MTTNKGGRPTSMTESEKERRRKIKDYIEKKYSLIGHKFGLLKVESEFIKDKRRYCVCQCECGNKKITLAMNLKIGKTKSCGCLQEKWRNKNNRVYKEDIYIIYKGIINRCCNKNNKRYKNYGGRGIKVCNEWLENYEKFKNWAIENNYSKGLSIERIDVNKDYMPENCCWIPIEKQAKNKTNTVYIELNGVKKPLVELCDMYDLSYKAVYWRIKNGWSSQKAIMTKTPTGFKKDLKNGKKSIRKTNRNDR